MNKPSFGVIVGRFQVHELHDGHIELIQTVRGLHNRVLIFLGVAPVLGSRRNPLDFITRKKLIQSSFPDVTVLPLPDMATDEVWSKELDHRISEIAPYGDVTLYGGRDSFVPHYFGKYKPVELPLKINQNGEDVRAVLSSNVIASPDFRAGVIYSTQNQYPKTVTCVDIAILSNTGKLLLVRKKGEKGFRFVGGHADPDADSFELDAVREAREETGFFLSYTNLQYVGSTVIDDWRYTKEVDKIKTILYLGVVPFGTPKLGDDLEGGEFHWFNESEFLGINLEPCHKPLMEMLIKFLNEKKGWNI